MSASISQDGSFIACPGPNGASLYQIEPFGRMKTSWPLKPCIRAYAFLRTGLPLTAVVYGSTPRSLAVYASTLPVPICELTMALLVHQVFMNRKRLLVLTSDGYLAVYELPQLSLIRRIRVGPKLAGKCAFNEELWLVVPCSSLDGDSDLLGAHDASPGSVIVYDVMNHVLLASFEAHTLPIRAIALSDTLIATTLEMGTLVRIHKVDTQSKTAKLHSTWRRGRQPSQIMLLRFSDDSAILACASRHTVHLFRVGDIEPVKSKWRFVPRMPHYASELVNLQQRSFACLRTDKQMDDTVQIAISGDTVRVLISPWLYEYKPNIEKEYKRATTYSIN